MKNITKNKIIRFLSFIIIGITAFVSIAFAGAPTVSTFTATNISQTEATLNGTFNSNGSSPMDVRFEYGTTINLGNFTSYTTKTANNGTFSHTISGLSPNTTYYYRAMGVNSIAPAFSTILSFTTSGYGMPTVITTNAKNINTDSATLNGTFNSNGSNTIVWFEYSTDSSLRGSSSTTSISYGGSDKGAFSTNLSGLSPNTTYYYRAVAQNSAGTKRSSAIISFTTLNNGGGGGGNDFCVINNFYADDYDVEANDRVRISYDTENCTNIYISGYGSVYNTSDRVSVYPYTTTTYTITASNSFNSDSRTFTVYVDNYNNYKDGNKKRKTINENCISRGNCRPVCSYFGNCNGRNNNDQNISIITTTRNANNINSGSATFSGSLYSNRGYSSAYFEYGTSPRLGNSTTRLYSNNVNTNYLYTVYNLKSNTTYYFRIVGEVDGRINEGQILSFTTSNSTSTTTINAGGVTTNKNDTDNKLIILRKNNSDTEKINNTNTLNGNDLNQNGKFLTAGAGFSGGSFFPNTILGWLLITMFILIVVMIARRIFSGYRVVKNS